MSMKVRLQKAAQETRAANEQAHNDLTQQIADAERKGYENAVQTLGLWLDQTEAIVTEHMQRKPAPLALVAISPLLDGGRYMRVRKEPGKHDVQADLLDDRFDLPGAMPVDSHTLQRAFQDQRLATKISEAAEAGVKIMALSEQNSRHAVLLFDYRSLQSK